MVRPKKYRFKEGNAKTENRMMDALEELANYEEFVAHLAPQLKKDLVSGMSSEDIYKKYSGMAAARAVAIATTERNPAVAMKAIQEVLDRALGKPTQKIEAKHRFDELSEEELDALVLAELKRGAIDVTDEGEGEEE